MQRLKQILKVLFVSKEKASIFALSGLILIFETVALRKGIPCKSSPIFLRTAVALLTLFIIMITITIEDASSSTTLTWIAPTTNTDGTPLTDLAGYKIYYGATSGNYTNAINVGNVTTYTFNNLTAGTTSYFVATAYDTAGIESVDSNQVAKIEPVVADTTAPTVTAFTVPSASTSLTVTITGLRASDNVGVTGYTVNESATAPLSTASGWSSSAQNSYTFATAGSKTLYAWAKDAAGNVSAGASSSVSINLSATTPACTSFAYTVGACQSNNTAPVVSYVSSPAGCSGGAAPATTQPCTYVPPASGACTYTYSGWGSCQSNNTRTRTVSSSTPAGCTGTPVTSQACTYIRPASSACTYTYSSWGTCQSNNTQTRTVSSSTPAGCTGTPATSQTCTYIAPAPGAAPMHVSIGVFRSGSWYTNTSHTGIWEQGVDTSLSFGVDGDIPIIGDWNGSGTQKIGVFRNGNWYLDINGNGTWDSSVDSATPFGMAGDIPVVGDWNGDGKTKIGVFRNGMWYLDYPGTGKWVGCGAPADPSKDACIAFGASGDFPIAADWNGSGTTKIGIFRNGTWYLDYPGTGKWVGCGAPADATKDSCINFGTTGDVPVAADWNGSGRVKIGVFRQGTWYLDMLGNGSWTPGVDMSLSFGTLGDTPIVK